MPEKNQFCFQVSVSREIVHKFFWNFATRGIFTPHTFPHSTFLCFCLDTVYIFLETTEKNYLCNDGNRLEVLGEWVVLACSSSEDFKSSQRSGKRNVQLVDPLFLWSTLVDSLPRQRIKINWPYKLNGASHYHCVSSGYRSNCLLDPDSSIESRL